MRRTAQGGVSSGAVAGEFFLALRRFVPDFKTLAGNCKISLGIKDTHKIVKQLRL